MKLSPPDWILSMAISKRRRDGEEKHELRNMLVHRLRLSAKAVLRMPLSQDIAKSRQYGIYCEPCKVWFTTTQGAGERFGCPQCSGVYVMEFAVFTRLPSTD